MVGEERISVDVVQVARGGVGRSGQDARDARRVQAQQVVEPRLDGVTVGVTDRLVQRHLAQRAACNTRWCVGSQ